MRSIGDGERTRLAGLLRLHSPKGVLFTICVLLAIANIVTLGADLGFLARADWRAAAFDTVLPGIQWSQEYLSVIGPIIGATLTTAAALFAHGHRQIETAKDAAAALAPAAGHAASWLFALGVIGTGVLAVPLLASSSAYAISEAMRWRASLEDQPASAPKFYGVSAAIDAKSRRDGEPRQPRLE